jgi:hypothetical protein
MEEKKLTDEQEDLLIEFDEYGFAPTITMPNAEEYAKAWKNTLIDMFQRLNFLQAEQKAEIERLTEYNENLNGMCLEFIDKNDELQKQVDELMKKIESYQHSFEYNQGYEDGKKKAVKDTAKEIIEEIDNVKEIFPNDIVGYERALGWCMCIDELKEIAKNKGIEVE